MPAREMASGELRKLTHEAADYRRSVPYSDHRCGTCAMYIPPRHVHNTATCTLVRRPIEFDYICDWYETKEDVPKMRQQWLRQFRIRPPYQGAGFTLTSPPTTIVTPPPPPVTGDLLLETGDFILLETGDKILLE